MDELYLPAGLRARIGTEPYTTDSVGMTEARVLLFADKVLKIQPESEETRTEPIMMDWLAGRLPAPACLYHAAEGGMSYLLMSRVRGKMACAREYLRDPVRLTAILADCLKRMWAVDITDCPVRWDLRRKLPIARAAAESGAVDVEDVEPETFGEGGFRDPLHLADWLSSHQPPEDPVLSHGDFCPENIFLENGQLSGLIDLGRTGIADRWQDIALCHRSLRHNFAGSGFDADLLFERLDIEPDREKLRYYTLLDELF